MKDKPSQTDLPIDPDHDHEHVDDDAENSAPVDEAVTIEPDENPIPAKKDEPAPAAPAAPAAAGDDVVPKRPRGRPRKETAATPAKKDAGADVTPKAAPRSEQVDQLRGLLQLRASAIGGMACQLAGWPTLTAEESALIDAEFEGWTPPPEMKKVFVLSIVVLPRALADNRLRRMIGLGPVDGGDEPDEARRQLAQQRAELERQQTELAQQRAELRQAQAQPAPATVQAQPAPAASRGKRDKTPEPEPEIKLVIPEGFL